MKYLLCLLLPLAAWATPQLIARPKDAGHVLHITEVCTGPCKLYQEGLTGRRIFLGRVFYRSGGYMLQPTSRRCMPLEETVLAEVGFAHGEPLTYLLVSDDQSLCLKVTVIPRPLVATNALGERIALTLSHPKGLKWLLQGTGFTPKSSISIRCGPEMTANACAEGHFTACLQPAIKGKSNGWSEVTVDSGRGEPLTLRFPWGKKALKEDIR